MNSIESMNSAGELELMAKMHKEAGLDSDSAAHDSSSSGEHSPPLTPSFDNFGKGAGVFQRGGIGTGGVHAPGFTPRFVKNNSSGNSKKYYQESDNDSDDMSDEFASYIQRANTKADEKLLQQKRCVANPVGTLSLGLTSSSLNNRRVFVLFCHLFCVNSLNFCTVGLLR